MQQDMCLCLSIQQKKTMQAGTQFQQKMRLELYPAPADLISMVNILYSCATISFIKTCNLFVSVPLLVILAVCCTFSTVASEHPCPHEEGSAHRQPLRSSDRPGTWRYVSVPHIGDQPHPLLQLPSWGHAGERRVMRGLWTLSQHVPWPLQVSAVEGWKENDDQSRSSRDLCGAFEVIRSE